MFENYTKEDYLKLYDKDLKELIKISSKITKDNFANKVEACSIVSARTGKCQENCRYCAQSSHNKANIECHPIISVEDVVNAAKSAKENGATKIGIVTSGRRPSDEDFKVILEMVRQTAKLDGITPCVSIGLVTEEQMKQLKEAGCKRFHHNINTSKNYHSSVCTTHTFDDRIKTVKLAQKYGLEVCCGVIIGMGESREDRVDMAMSIAQLNPESTPINILCPIKGTPFEDYEDKIDEEEILKTICIFRIILPKVALRYAGGRTSRLSKENQKLGIEAGINSLLVGNYLTTLGSDANEDKKMLEDMGLDLV